jgi:predicted transposase YdaD
MLDLRTADVTQTRFYQEVFQVGQQEGWQVGQQEGRQEGKADLVLRQLTRRCGVLSLAQENQIRGLEIEQLEGLGDALLDFTGMLDLENWLKVHSGG